MRTTKGGTNIGQNVVERLEIIDVVQGYRASTTVDDPSNSHYRLESDGWSGGL